ncbi:hypothetical protein AKJ49_00325 [candidate division MSBL1 archaeon SCGC-AAA382A03]|uniref:Uncharacterized protein n=1 Tax=candidate division MSBL1 archaeon SCGC-AAA382A03 TaxID=1698278 RepID=A0A133VGV2_9EURY|nr:hypothetical protein AKJ49_00325 [candidate division MSBL1 archaeon SCGC-AAA382A03]
MEKDNQIRKNWNRMAELTKKDERTPSEKRSIRLDALSIGTRANRVHPFSSMTIPETPIKYRNPPMIRA